MKVDVDLLVKLQYRVMGTIQISHNKIVVFRTNIRWS